MTVAVVIPWRPSAERWCQLHWVMRRLHQARHQWSAWDGAQVILATDSPTGDGPWCKARAVANGIADTDTDVDIIVIHDADVWSEGTRDAVEQVANGASWAVPHGDVHRLDDLATLAVLDGAIPDETMPTTQPPYLGVPGGGIVVIRSDDYRRVPLDPRFLGWGQEDEAWGAALSMMLGDPWRGDAPLWHLWHPPQPRLNRHVGNADGNALLVRYRYARTSEQMRALLAEIGAAP